MTEKRLLAAFGRVREMLHGRAISLSAEEFLSIASLAKLVMPAEPVPAGGRGLGRTGEQAIETAWLEMGGSPGEGTYVYEQLNRQLAEKIIELYAFAPELYAEAGGMAELSRFSFKEDSLPGSCCLRDDTVSPEYRGDEPRTEVFPASENGYLLVPTPLP